MACQVQKETPSASVASTIMLAALVKVARTSGAILSVGMLAEVEDVVVGTSGRGFSGRVMEQGVAVLGG